MSERVYETDVDDGHWACDRVVMVYDYDVYFDTICH